jgi:hypothetical protein
MATQILDAETRSRTPVRTIVRYRDLFTDDAIGLWQKGELLDLSLSGARFWCPETVPVEADLEVRLELDTADGCQVLDLPALCVRVEENGIAVRFVNMTQHDKETLGLHLSRIARRSPERPTMKRAPRNELFLPQGRTTQVL